MGVRFHNTMMLPRPAPESFSDAGNAVFPKAGSVIKTLRPRNEKELVDALRKAAAEKITVTITAALTGLTGSGVPLESGYRIDTSEMIPLADRPGYHRVAPFLLISESNPLEGLIAPGVSLRELNDVLNKLGLWYPPHPGEMRALIGGNVATNASGPRTFAFGSTRDYVLSLRIVLMDGDVLNLRRGENFANGESFSLKSESGKIFTGSIPDYVLPKIKNAAGLFSEPGMDLIDLFISSEGILGCFSEIGLRFLPKRKIQAELVFMPTSQAALDLVDELRLQKADAGRFASDPQASALGILSLEFFDKNSLKLAKQNGFSIPASARTAIEIEAFDGDKSTWKTISASIEKFGGIGILRGKEVEEFRYAVPRAVAQWIKVHSVPKLGTDFAVPVKSFRELYRFYQQAEKEFGGNSETIRTANWGHIGDSHLHFNFLCETPNDVEKAKGLYLQLVREAVRLGGTISAEHGVGKKILADEHGVLRPYLFYMLGDQISQIAGIKKIFDPLFLLNQGNMIPISMLLPPVVSLSN